MSPCHSWQDSTLEKELRIWSSSALGHGMMPGIWIIGLPRPPPAPKLGDGKFWAKTDKWCNVLGMYLYFWSMICPIFNVWIRILFGLKATKADFIFLFSASCNSVKVLFSLRQPEQIKVYPLVKSSVVRAFKNILNKKKYILNKLLWQYFFLLEGSPFLEVMQYQVDAWTRQRQLFFHLHTPEIHLICYPRIEDISDMKLLRTDTTLDLSQKAEKRCFDKFFA